MKYISRKLIMIAFCAIPFFASAGDDYCAFTGESNACAPTGYIFAYGGFFTGYDVDGHEPKFPSREQITMDSGHIYGGGAGIYTKMFKRGRLEVERLHAKNDIGRITSDIFDGRGYIDYGFRGQFQTDAFMVNMYKEIPFCKFTGYIGGGIGFSENELTIFNTVNQANNEIDEALAYQFIAGVDIPVSKCVDIFFQYKLLGVQETYFEKIDLVIDSHITHNFVLGARLSF